MKRKLARKLAHAALAEIARRYRGVVHDWPSAVASVLELEPQDVQLVARYLKEFVDAHDSKSQGSIPSWKH